MTHAASRSFLKPSQDLPVLGNRNEFPRITAFRKRHLQDAIGLGGVLVDFHVSAQLRFDFVTSATISHEELAHSCIARVAMRIARIKDVETVFVTADHHVCVLGSEKAAWFKDTEGNYLCIHEDLPT